MIIMLDNIIFKYYFISGLMKFRSEDIDKIFHRLVADMNARVAIGLLPGFPAYVLFMCIRYAYEINFKTK